MRRKVAFVAMPVLFDIVTADGSSGFLAATPNVVNCLMIDPAGAIIMSKPGIACFETDAVGKVPQAQDNLHDFWDLHVREGNIHCASAVVRRIPADPPWWERVPNWE